MGNLRVAAYARYSTDNQTENSIAYQMQGIEKYCSENGYEIIRRYKDEAKSGTNTNRANFISLLQAAHNQEFEAVVIYDISRGSRDVADWFSFRKEMMSLGINVISVQDNLGDLLNPNDFLVELLGVGIGQHQVLQTRQKSIDGVATAAKKGLFLGGCAPIGYDIVNQQYVINPREAKIVQKIFAMYAAGHSYSDIIDTIGPVTGKKGRPVGKNSLYNILKNDRYIGIYTWNRREVKKMGKWAGGKENANVVKIEGVIEPIIDRETWNAVQERLKTNKRSGHKAKREYLLTGLIQCQTCGANYCGRTSVNQRGCQNPYYVCGNKTRTRSCTSKNVKASDMDDFVRSVVRLYLESVDLDIVAQNIRDNISKSIGDHSAETLELVEVCAKIKNATNAILSGISYPELMEEVNSLRDRKTALEKTLSESKADDIVSVDEIKGMLSGFIKNLDVNIDSVVRQFVKKIEVQHDGNYTVTLGLNIAHSMSSGSAQYVVCATYTAPRR